MRFKNNSFPRGIKGKINSGSSLVTVVVVVAFLSIIATIMLYLSGQNYKTKVIDQRVKESFYEAEEVVELFKTQLIRDVADASEPAFALSSMNYVQNKNEDIRAEEYFTYFKEEFDDEWRDHWYTTDGGTRSAQESISSFFPGASVTSSTDGDYVFTITVNGNPLTCTLSGFGPGSFNTITTIYDSEGNASRYYVNDINIEVRDNRTDYISVIKTSFEITPPMLNWGEEERNDAGNLSYSDCVAYYYWYKE